MSAPEPREIPFTGVRLRFDSSKNFDELVDALLSDVGEKPVMIDDIAINCESWDTPRKRSNPASGQVVSCSSGC